ncbi:hypothetical protein [Vibrio parahaemolyticus]|uniref:hypothetical protein n=1 Tax=Vibrio parahaemolyticus TaxID=670 RepID=UPI001F4F5C0D|nr:hypothetical protein [Vibrio parahaemolyticus]HCM0862620.1 hypothetical protein [Vibrio parahaemolyticus]
MDELIEKIIKIKPTIIWIDGKNGSGKSFLAEKLGLKLNIPVIHVDDYLITHQNSYVASLKLDELKQTIGEALRPLIVEGVCLLKVRECLGFENGFDVYVKRMSPMGYWADEDECDISESPEIFIQQQQEILKKFSSLSVIKTTSSCCDDSEFPALTREIIEYHFKYRPHEYSDVIYHRVDK